MKLSDLNDWITLGANIGVLVGLLVLIVEISQNTRVAQASAYQDLVSQISEINYLQATDDELQSALSKASSELGSLSDEDKAKVMSLKRIVFRHGDLAYHQYELGLITDERLRSALGVLRAHLVESEIGRTTWLEMRPSFTRNYVEYVENMMFELEPESGYWR